MERVPGNAPVSSLFCFDTRSLAAARILAGLLLLGDLLNRSKFLVAHYTSEGALPALAVFEDLRDVGFPSLYFVNDTPLFVGLLFLLSGATAVALTVGYHTRLSTALCWYLYASVQYRNPLINTGGDVLLKFLLLWCIFVPWGAEWSVDKLLRRQPAVGRAVSCTGVTVLGLQMVLLYLSSVANKWHPTWVKDGTALYYALSVDHITTPYAQFLYRRPALMEGLTFGVVGFEFLGGLLLLVPRPRLRLVVVPAFLFMHFSFGIFIELGIFRYAPMVGLLAFLPSLFWEKLPAFSTPGRSRKAALIKAFRKLPRPPRYQFDWAGQPGRFFLIAAFTYGVLTCLQGLADQRLIPRPIDRLGWALGLNQHWPMFIYLDKVKDGWYVMEAELADGTVLDLIHGGPVDFEKPSSMESTYEGVRWRRFMTNIIMPPSQAVLPWYSKYVRRNWDERHPNNPIVKLTLYFMNDQQRLYYRYTPADKRILDIWGKPEGEDA